MGRKGDDVTAVEVLWRSDSALSDDCRIRDGICYHRYVRILRLLAQKSLDSQVTAIMQPSMCWTDYGFRLWTMWTRVTIFAIADVSER